MNFQRIFNSSFNSRECEYRRHFVFIICFSLIRAFSLHFLQPFYSYFFFFSPTQKSLSRNVWNVSKIERKKIHVFYLLSWLNVYTYLRSWLYFRMKRKNGRFLTDFPKSRSFPKSWSERNIYVHRFKFDGSKGDAVNSKKQTSRAW